jgi:anti-sigma B factor antagonist
MTDALAWYFRLTSRDPKDLMPLEHKSLVCGTVHVIECKGRIVAGPEGESLLLALRQDWCRDLKQVVLHMGEVTRLDSTGLGLIIRSATHLRQRGGDLRLSDVPAPIQEILQLTRIDSILKVLPTLQDAILSFLEKSAAAPCVPSQAGRVLLVEQSPDFCAFATALLTQHAYAVTVASLVRDAKVLLMIEEPDFILIGPSIPPDAVDATRATFRSLAPNAKIRALDPALKTHDPHLAGEVLQQTLLSQTEAHA